MEIQCKRHCGFRVDDMYFVRKTRFTPGLCPRCNGPIEIVNENTDDIIPGAKVDVNPQSGRFRQVVMGV